jgi:hypothetical protein
MGERKEGRRRERERKKTMQSRKTIKKRERGSEGLDVAISLCWEQLADECC